MLSVCLSQVSTTFWRLALLIRMTYCSIVNTAGQGQLLSTADATPRAPSDSKPSGSWEPSDIDVRAIARTHAGVASSDAACAVRRLHRGHGSKPRFMLAGRGLMHLLAFSAGAWRRRYCVPLHPTQDAALLNNSSVLKTGRSLQILGHPIFPMCILGYGHKAPAG